MEEHLLFFTQYQEKMYRVLYEKLKQETPSLLVRRAVVVVVAARGGEG